MTAGKDDRMMAKCSELKPGNEVVFLTYSDIYKKKIPETGSVLQVNPERRAVSVIWLDGYKSRDSEVPYEDMLAVHDGDGEEMRFENIHGPSRKLTAE